jgi:hypothetical protein
VKQRLVRAEVGGSDAQIWMEKSYFGTLHGDSNGFATMAVQDEKFKELVDELQKENKEARKK